MPTEVVDVFAVAGLPKPDISMLADNRSAVEALKDAGIAAIARELTLVVHRTASIDWTQKKSVQAKLRLAVKKLLKTHGYPPDGADRATLLVLEQAERREEGWTYILRGDRALSLAPMVAFMANEDGAGHGLFLARELGVAPASRSTR